MPKPTNGFALFLVGPDAPVWLENVSSLEEMRIRGPELAEKCGAEEELVIAVPMFDCWSPPEPTS